MAVRKKTVATEPVPVANTAPKRKRGRAPIIDPELKKASLKHIKTQVKERNLAKGLPNGPVKGRPTLEDPTAPEQAFRMCLLGLNNEQLAKYFDVDISNLQEWIASHVDFREAIKDGRERADGMILNALYHKALGYSHSAVKIFWDPKTDTEKIIPYVERYPPDATAAIFLLKNRQRERFGDRAVNDDGPGINAFLQATQPPPDLFHLGVQ